MTKLQTVYTYINPSALDRMMFARFPIGVVPEPFISLFHHEVTTNTGILRTLYLQREILLILDKEQEGSPNFKLTSTPPGRYPAYFGQQMAKEDEIKICFKF